jgi:hypothetical protein
MMPLRLPRKDLPPIPPRMQSLPVDGRGYPVPWFVEWINGLPDFRVMDRRKWGLAIRFGHCWLCGEPVGRQKTFVIGPMCAVNRTTSEPACHEDCAIFAATACPFLTLPKAKRRDANLPDHGPQPGFALERNPGATCLWTTTTFKLFNPGANEAARAQGAGAGQLINLGDPTSPVRWYAEGRAATRAEVWFSIQTGLPALREVAEKQDAYQHSGTACVDYLDRQITEFQKYLPEAA